jgi:hypothetical protein
LTKIGIEELKCRLEAGEETTVVDSRSATAWGGSGIKARGAIRIPPDEVAEHIVAVSPGEFIVDYCT